MLGHGHTRNAAPEGGTGYHGPDRRAGEGVEAAPGHLLMVGAGGLLLVAALISASAPYAQLAEGNVLPLLSSHLDSAGMAIAVLVGVLCLMRFRLMGEAPTAWIGVALLMYGLVYLWPGYVVATFLPPGTDLRLFEATATAGYVVVVGLVVLALVSPDVHDRLRPAHIMIGALAATAIAATGAVALPETAREALTVASGAGRPATAVVVMVWSGLAAVYAVRAMTRREGVFAWFALLWLALALTHAAAWFGGWASASGTVGVIRISGLLFALLGTVHELMRIYVQQRGALFRSQIQQRDAEADRRAWQDAQQERAHEARNALIAIEGATRTLERHSDQLDTSSRAALTAAIEAEIARLQRLVTVHEPGDLECAPLQVADAVAPVVATALARGMDIRCDISEHLHGVGRVIDLQAVLHNLVENARRYAQGPVTVRASQYGGSIILQVDDCGPGIPVHERARIFQRGVRGEGVEHRPGSGLGLYVSAELMTAQGGDLWVTDSTQGGASFRMRLPAISVLRQLDHKVAQFVKTSDGVRTVATAFVDDDVEDAVRRDGQQDG